MSYNSIFTIDTDHTQDQPIYLPDGSQTRVVTSYPCYITSQGHSRPYDFTAPAFTGLVREGDLGVELIGNQRVCTPHLPETLIAGLSYYLENETHFTGNPHYDSRAFVQHLLGNNAGNHNWVPAHPRNIAPGQAITLTRGSRYTDAARLQTAIKVADHVFLTKIGRYGLAALSLTDLQHYTGSSHLFARVAATVETTTEGQKRWPGSSIAQVIAGLFS
jgi:hypothetical protein